MIIYYLMWLCLTNDTSFLKYGYIISKKTTVVLEQEKHDYLLFNVWIYALLRWKMMKEISSQVCRLSRWYSFQASSCVWVYNLLNYISLKKWLVSIGATHIYVGNKS